MKDPADPADHRASNIPAGCQSGEWRIEMMNKVIDLYDMRIDGGRDRAEALWQEIRLQAQSCPFTASMVDAAYIMGARYASKTVMAWMK